MRSINVSVWQTPEYRNMFQVEKEGIHLQKYRVVWSGSVEVNEENDWKDECFRIFNIEHPSDYKARSLSIGDILEKDGRFWAVDRIGFREVEVSESSKNRNIVKGFPIGIENRESAIKNTLREYGQISRRLVDRRNVCAEAIEKIESQIKILDDNDSIVSNLMNSAVILLKRVVQGTKGEIDEWNEKIEYLFSELDDLRSYKVKAFEGIFNWIDEITEKKYGGNTDELRKD